MIPVSAPATITTLATHDISADRTRATLNGHNETIATGDKGAGNFGNYPLYVGARGAGTSSPFKGNIYSLCIIGTLLSPSEQALLERYLNAKTRAYYVDLRTLIIPIALAEPARAACMALTGSAIRRGYSRPLLYPRGWTEATQRASQMTTHASPAATLLGEFATCLPCGDQPGNIEALLGIT